MFVQDKEVKAEQMGPGTTRKLMAYDGSLMMTRVAFTAGAQGARHKHPHEQISYIATGRFLVQIGSDQAELSAGDSFYVPSEIEHEVKALEAGELVDVFTPQRLDFLRQG